MLAHLLQLLNIFFINISKVFETKMAPGRCTRQRTMTITGSIAAPLTSDNPSQHSPEDAENVGNVLALRRQLLEIRNVLFIFLLLLFKNNCILKIFIRIFSFVASRTLRKGRGKTRGVAVAEAIDATGGRIKITFPPGKLTPVGGWAKSWKSELGVICRTLAPITCKGWKKMIKEDKQVIYDRIVVSDK